MNSHTRTLAARLFAAALLLAGAGSALATVHYVDVNSTNATPPYTNWATAARVIQDAVDAAVEGEEIVVTNGLYGTGGRELNYFPFDYNRVAVGKPLSIRSISGPQFTTIIGYGALRCVYLTNGASLSGFTLAYGCSRNGGGAFGGTLNNCTLTGNTTHCGFTLGYDAYGGGASGCTLNNCTLTGNSVVASGRAVGGGAIHCTLNNCTLTGNSAENPFLLSSSEGFGAGVAYCMLNNCTLSENSIRPNIGHVFGNGAYASTLNNCIVYFNYGQNYYSCTLNYSCTTPNAGGLGNITNAPLFVDQASGNLRLQSNSPCINAGWNAFAPGGPDLDGNPRIVGRRIDIGAYEFQSLDLIGSGVVSNQFGFHVTGQSNWVFVLEASGDFTNWTALTTNALNGSPFPYSDPAAPNLPQRFYRVRQQLP
jgi:hypothetical protein